MTLVRLVASLEGDIQNRGVYRVPTYCKNTSGALNIICRFHLCSQKMSYSTLFTLNWINSLRKMLQKAMCAKAKCIWWLVTTETHYHKYVLSLTVGVTRGTPAKSLKAKSLFSHPSASALWRPFSVSSHVWRVLFSLTASAACKGEKRVLSVSFWFSQSL